MTAHSSRSSRTRRVLGALVTLFLAFAAGADTKDEIARAEALGLARYHEGFPPEYGAQISEAGAAHLAELLADPAHAAHHPTLMEALAASAHPGAYEALAGYAKRDFGDTVDARELRGLRVLRGAMGRLAQSDDRALAWLLDDASQPGPAAFRAGPYDAARVGARLHRQALIGLGLSGRPEALARLRAAAAGADPAASRAAQIALELHSGATQ